MLKILGDFVISNANFTDVYEVCTTEAVLQRSAPVETIKVFDEVNQVFCDRTLRVEDNRYFLQMNSQQFSYDFLAYLFDKDNVNDLDSTFDIKVSTILPVVTEFGGLVTIPEEIEGFTTNNNTEPSFFDPEGCKEVPGFGFFPNYMLESAPENVLAAVSATVTERILSQNYLDRYAFHGTLIDNATDTEYYVRIPEIVLVSDYNFQIGNAFPLRFEVIRQTNGSFFQIANVQQ